MLSLPSGALRMKLAAGNADPEVEGAGLLPSWSSYLIGNQPDRWHSHVRHYGRVVYRKIYPGIDLAYYGKGRQLEHDFVVEPGADPGNIRMRFGGADRMYLDADGSLVLDVAGTAVRFSRPVAYQELGEGARTKREEVASGYVLLGTREAGFSLGAYDRRRKLVIDPVLSYSTYLGGSYYDEATAVTVDPEGNIWVAGSTETQDFPTVGKGLQETGGAARNVFLTKINPFAAGSASLVYSGFLGGLRDEEPSAVAVDAAGNVYLTGTTTSGDFPTTESAYDPDSTGGNQNAFVMKINAGLPDTAPILYSTYLGGEEAEAAEAAFGATVDGSGLIYVTGVTESEDFPLAGNPMQNSGRGGWEAFLSIIDPSKAGVDSLHYSTYFGGDSTDVATDVALGDAQNVYFTGYTMSTDFPVAGAAYQGQPGGLGDVFLTRVDFSKSGLDALSYSTYLGGSDFEMPYGLTRDASGKFYLAGYTLSEDFPIAGQAIQTANAGNADAFVAILDLTLPGAQSLTYSTYLGGSDADVPYGVALDSTGSVVLAGYTTSTDFPTRGDTFHGAYSGLVDAFFARLDPAKPAAQGLVCSSYFGAELIDVVNAFAVDHLDNLYLVGVTRSEQFPVTGSAYQNERPGFFSAFISKLGPCASDGAGVTVTPPPDDSSTSGTARRGPGTGDARVTGRSRGR